MLPNVQVDGTLNVEGEVFIPSGTTFSKVVEVTGNQNIDGIKTFVKSPIVPTPTTGTQVANKEYVDLKVALADFTGGNQSLVSNGYQKLPGGLILQWGISENISSGSSQTITLPITFNNGILHLYTTLVGGIPNNSYTSVVSVISASQFSIGHHSSTGQAGLHNWLAIGY